MRDRHFSTTAARWTSVAVAVLLLPVMVLASFDFGVTWDEGARHANGVRVAEYLSGERDPSLLRGGHVYGGMFDLLAVLAERQVDANRYVVRHVVNAMFGWMGVLFCGALAARLYGAWTGVLAMVLLAGSPRYFAHSMNNPKDLPFAAMSVAALYAISRVSPAWPYLTRSTALVLIAGLAAALNVRPAALFNFGFFGLLLGLFVIADGTRDWRRLAITAARAAVVVVAALLLGTALWPWAQQEPLSRPFEALFEASEYPWAGLVLFDGRNYTAPELPWNYPLDWLLISTPPVVLTGALLALVPGPRAWMLSRAALAFVVALPVVLVLVKDSTLYDGLRHLLFTYPPMVALAASGWVGLLSVSTGWTRYIAAALLAAGVLNIVAYQVRYHPNQAVYFNELVGGTQGAFTRYELDYWGNCILQAVEWSAEKARAEDRQIAISGSPAHLVEHNARRYPELTFSRREPELMIRLNRGTRQAVSDLARRDDALHQVETPDGTVLCVVLPAQTPETRSSVDFPESDDE